jgi:DNA repair photolyase
MRWKLASEEDAGGQGVLFGEDEVVHRHVGAGEYRGLEFLEVRARRLINEVPASARMPFRWTINAYRGCSHACVYCQAPDTPVLMGDGSLRRIADIRPGDVVYGTERDGRHRRYVRTPVLAHWETLKPAWRVVLDDGTELLSSADHRYLTDRGWKFVTGTDSGPDRRPHLTTRNELFGTGQFASSPKHDAEYRRGYLCGSARCGGAMVEAEQHYRVDHFLRDAGVADWGASEAGDIAALAPFFTLPDRPTRAWSKGFLAAVYDAVGSYRRGALRISGCDGALLARALDAAVRLGFDAVMVALAASGGEPAVRIRGDLREQLRFFHVVDPAIMHKRSIEGGRVDSGPHLRVVAIEPLGLEVPMYDITTGTGDFIANGIVSHNCFARPTHDYLGLDIGADFDSKIVVKVNAVERVRAELAAKRWAGDPIAMGTNTDPYQRCEGKYHLTRGIVQALGEARNPFSILTKSTLILRDLPLLAEAAERTKVRVNFSIGTLDEATWKATEPGTPHPRQRVEAVRRINEAGIPCGVLVAPVIPGMSDHPDQVEEVVRACADAGAVSVSAMLLHLRPVVKHHYLGWLAKHRPDLLPMYERRYRRSGYLPKADHAPLREIVKRVHGR